ncbi:MAG: hypothetical protein WCS10_04110 [Bacteroidales bacterium]|jgi:hypothetical protein|nr:hypothetical protein [Bacteroidales bacterium]
MFNFYINLIKKNQNKISRLLFLIENKFGKQNLIKISCSYFEYQKIQPQINDCTIICIINQYNEKESLLEFDKIINDPRTIVSVDLFHIALISQNTKLSHQHYIL